MRVATYNIRHGLPPGRADVDNRRMARDVASLDADVVGLQEVDRHTARSGGADQALLVARACGAASHHFGAAIRLGEGQYGNALVVRGDLVDVTDVPLPSRGEARQAIIATVRSGGAAFTVAVAHLQNHKVGRAHEAPAQLDALLDDLDRRVGPLVLMGDLNLGPGPVVPRLAGRGYRPVDGPPTFPSDRPRDRIDWIAVRGWVVDEVEVPDLRSSDHRPLVADLGPDPVTPVRLDAPAPGSVP